MILPDEIVVKLYKAFKQIVGTGELTIENHHLAGAILEEADQYFNRSIQEQLSVMKDVELCAYWNILNMNGSMLGNDATTNELHLSAVREILKIRGIPFEEGKLIIKKTVLAKGSQNQNKRIAVHAHVKRCMAALRELKPHDKQVETYIQQNLEGAGFDQIDKKLTNLLGDFDAWKKN